MEAVLCVVLLGIIIALLLWIYWLICVAKDRKIYAEHLLDENEMIREFLELKQNGGVIKEYLDASGYIKIAVWGIDRIGRVILKELYAEKINVVCCIDDTINNQYDIDVDVYYPLENFTDVDAVICIFPLSSRWAEVSRGWGVPIVNLVDIVREIKKQS